MKPTNKIKELTDYKTTDEIQPDFVDFDTKTIYELKPYNPRAMKAGWKQIDIKKF